MRKWPWLLLPGAVVIAAAPFTPSPDPLPGRSGGPVQERSGAGAATSNTSSALQDGARRSGEGQAVPVAAPGTP